MTRINLIHPWILYDQHLLAEHRELKRIPNQIKTWKLKSSNIPEKFCLGTGHVLFFTNKLSFLKKRYQELYEECKRRWFNVENYISAFDWLPEELFWEYNPSDEDIYSSTLRINSKYRPNFYRYKWIII